MVLRLLVLAMLCIGVLVQNAAADCVSDCQASTYCGGSSYDCSRELSMCYSRCSSDSYDSAPAGEYGAIAYDKDSWAYGLADESPDKDSARKSAMRFCSKHGDDCRIVETFSNTCAAVAEDNAGVVGWGTDDNRQKAMDEAVEECDEESDDGSCRVVLKHCYGE